MLATRTARVAVRVTGLLVITGCAATRAEPAPAPVKPARSAVRTDVAVGPPRLVPPSSGGSVNVLETASDGTRFLVSHGLRMLEHPDGSVELARDFFPTGRVVNSLALPPRLGGGYLFYAQSSGTTLFWRSPSFIGPLLPVAQVDGEVGRVVPGFDRLYLMRDRRAPWLALDLEEPRPLELAGLPASPAYGPMAFADEWFGAVELPYRGLLATFDGGASYRPVGISALNLRVSDGELLVESQGANYALAADGTVRPLDPPPGRGGVQRAQELKLGELRRPAAGPLGRRPLELAVLHGVPIARDQALVAAGGALGRVSLTDGSVLEMRERAYVGTAHCHGMPLGDGVGFLCSEPGGKTRILAYAPPHELREVASFDEPRFVSANRGSLAVRGSCRPSGGAPGMYCIMPRKGAKYELMVEGDLGVERVVALDDGRTAVLIPPRLGAKGSLALIEPGGREVRRVLEVPRVSDPVLAGLLKQGLWLTGFEQDGQKGIRGWIAGEGPIVGVRVKLDGKVELGKIEHGGVERALISGRYAVVIGNNGTMVESTDGGFEWQAVELPAEPQLGRPRGATQPPINGCTSIGCAFGGWLRIGYRQSDTDGELVRAEIPKPVRVPSPGGGRWSLDCWPSGEVSPEAQSMPVDLDEHVRPELVRGPWLPFWEERPPKLARTEVGFDIGTESELTQMRAYAWGPAGGDWSKVGKWQVRVADRTRVGGAIWSTAPSRSPWDSAEITADAFGYTPSGNITAFRILLEASGRSALLNVATRGRNDLYLVEEGRAITPIRSSGTLGSLSGWVKLGAKYYVGATTDSRNFRVYQVSDGELELLADYPELPGAPLAPTLVRSTRGESLGLWTRSSSWYVFPIDLSNGKAGAPIEIEPASISSMPRACSGGEDGWLLSGSLGIEPYIDFPGSERRISTRSFEARLIAGAGDVCVEGLAAQGEVSSSKPGVAAAQTPRAPLESTGVPFVVSDRGERGRRLGFRCTN